MEIGAINRIELSWISNYRKIADKYYTKFQLKREVE